MIHHQQELRWDVITRFREGREAVYKVLAAVYDKIPFDHIVIDTDSAASSVSQGVHREDKRRAHVDVLVYFLARPESAAIVLEALCAVCSMRAVPLELTAEQTLAKMARGLADNPGLKSIVEQVTGVRL